MENTLHKKIIKPDAKATRAIAIERAAVQEDRTVSLAFSSEAPYDRSWGREILDHTPASVNLSRLKAGAPLLIDHDNSIRSQVGIIESVEIGADRVGRAIVRFGKTALADEVFQQVTDGIVRNISVGYMIDDAQEESRDATGYPTVRVTSWTPYEISCVSVPADYTGAGIGRALETETPFIDTPKKDIKMIDPVIDVAGIEKTARENELKRSAAIIGTAEQFKDNAAVQKLASDAVRNGMDLDAFRGAVMEKLASGMPTPAIGMDAKEVRKYSIRNAILAAASGDWSKAGFEREASMAIAQRQGAAQNGGFFVPYEVQKRDMTSAGVSGSNYLVATENLAGSFIDLLRARSTVAQLGATMLPGLVGNITIPKQTGANTAYWLTNEATAITEGQMTIGQLSLTPKTVGVYTELSRLMLLQSTPAADALVMDDFAKVLAIAIDAAALTGPGSGGAPTGITATGSIGGVTGTSIAYAGMLEFQSDLATANALTANCAYVTTPAVAALLAARVKFSSTASPLWDGSLLDANVCGFRGAATTQMTAAAMLFGDFSQVVIGEWGVLELAVSNSEGSNFKAGIVGVRAFQTVDVGVRNAAAFSLATSIT